jgi:hypothetical protein
VPAGLFAQQPRGQGVDRRIVEIDEIQARMAGDPPIEVAAGLGSRGPLHV